MSREKQRAASKAVKKKKLTQANIQYVFPLGNGWVVKTSSLKKFTVITDSKREAIAIARNMAKHKGIRLIVYNKGGDIYENTNYARRKKAVT